MTLVAGAGCLVGVPFVLWIADRSMRLQDWTNGLLQISAIILVLFVLICVATIRYTKFEPIDKEKDNKSLNLTGKNMRG